MTWRAAVLAAAGCSLVPAAETEKDASVHIAIPVFPEITALDAVGPYEVLQRLPGAVVTFVGHKVGPVRTSEGYLGLLADAEFEEIPHPDVLVVPGGRGTRSLLDDQRLLAWLRTAHPRSRFTTSVCTGSLLLAAAGFLQGKTATTHWASRDLLGSLGARPVSQRVVEHLDDRIITAAGVSSGLDMALRLCQLLVDRTAAEAIQLMIEYAPEPPTSMGRLELASAEVLARVDEYRHNSRR